MANSSKTPVQSIDRVFDLIETLSSASHGMTLTDLSAGVGLHVSTTHRLLSSLVSRGYVQKDVETGKYRLTLRMFEIGSRVLDGLNLVSIARPHLEYLADLTRETIHLVARRQNEVVYLYKEDTQERIIRMASAVGRCAPMYCTAVGKCILAYLSPEEVQRIWDGTAITAYTPRTCTSKEALLESLEVIRRQGFSVDNEEYELGVRCVAAPIFDYSGAPIAAISISAPAARIDESKQALFTREALACANKISSLMGGPCVGASS